MTENNNFKFIRVFVAQNELQTVNKTKLDTGLLMSTRCYCFIYLYEIPIVSSTRQSSVLRRYNYPRAVRGRALFYGELFSFLFLVIKTDRRVSATDRNLANRKKLENHKR